MRRKILSILCVLALLFANVTFVLAEEKEMSKEEQILYALNIHPGETVTRESFIYALMGYIYDDAKIYGSAEELARAHNILDDGEVYNPTSTVSYEDGIKYAVRLLGYDIEAEQKGGTLAAYRQIAANIGIIKGIPSATKKITTNVAITMLYQMLEVKPIVYDFSYNYVIEKEGTLIGTKRGIGTVEGILTADEYTSIYGEKEANEGCIIIGETEYALDGVDTHGLLGKKVIAYAKYDEEISSILYISKKDNANEELVLESKDIWEITPDFSEIRYEVNGRIKKAKLDPVPRVIYNGEYYSEYTIEDFTPDIGNIRLLDNDGNGKYDIVFVSEYQTVVVSSIDPRNKEIYNEYTFESSVRTIKAEDDCKKCSIYKGGEEISFSELKASDVLSVLISKGQDEKIIEIYVSEKESVEGTVRKLDQKENLIYINGVEYYMSADFNRYLKDKGMVVEFGKTYEFSFDYMGNVAYVETVSDDDYYLFLEAKTIRWDDIYYIRCMNLNEEWKDIRLSKKVYIDDIKYSAEIAYEKIVNLQPQLIKLRLDSMGEIKHISLPVTSSTYEEDKFTKTPFTTLQYRKYPKCFNMIWYMESDVKVVVFPNDETSREMEDYYTVSAGEIFVEEDNFNISVYDADRFGFTKMIVVREPEAQATVSYFVVSGIAQQEMYGDAYYVLKGATNDYTSISVPVSDRSLIEGIKRGDVINVNLGRDGPVNVVKKVCSLSNFEHVDPGTYYNARRVSVAGTVVDEEISDGKIMIDCSPQKDGTSIVSFKVNTNISVIDCNPVTGVCTKESVQSIRTGDRLVVGVDSGVVSSVIRVDN